MLQFQATQHLLDLSEKELSRQPALYFKRLCCIPLLPAPRILEPSVSPQLPEVTSKSSDFASPEYILYSEPEGQAEEPRYITTWGCLTFEEIYDRTHRYTRYLLQQRFLASDEDADDGLQVGYLQLWQHLQDNPDLLEDRKPGWIAKHVLYGAMHVQHREHVHQKRSRSTALNDDHEAALPGEVTVFQRSGSFGRHSHESRQTDIRIDLETAIVSTANHILAQPAGKAQDRALWALYGITMLQVQITEMSKLFRVNQRSMKKAYDEVRQQLQRCLDGYAPSHPTRPIHARRNQTLPSQDITAIRQQNSRLCPEQFATVRTQLEKQKPDTLERDLLALEGIRAGIPARQQARTHQVNYSAMQRAYERMHLLLAATVNPTIRPRRPEKKQIPQFSFAPEHEPRLKQLANELMSRPQSQGWLVALYAYICNLPGRTTARHFKMQEATLRQYRHKIHERFTTLVNTIECAERIFG